MFGGVIGNALANAKKNQAKAGNRNWSGVPAKQPARNWGGVPAQNQYTPPGIGIGQGGGSLRQGQTPAQWNAGNAAGFNDGYGGGVGTGGNAGAPIPAPAPPPAPPKETYSMSDKNSRIASVDSTFRDQESLYNQNLEKFIADIGRRRKTLIYDTDRAEEGVARNKNIGLTGVGEDFASRGLGHSGLFVDASEKGRQAYDRQKTSLLDAEANGLGDMLTAETKEKTDNAARIQAAKRDALYRLQLKNNLVTGL